MKEVRALVLALLAAGSGLILASCEAGDVSAYSARQMADVIVSSLQELPPLSVMTSEEEYFGQHLENVYLLDTGVLRDGAIYYAEGTQASEIAVLEVTDGVAPQQVADELEEYIDRRAASFTGYFPQQAALVENSMVSVNGDYVALLICEDPVDAQTAFLACFGDDPPELPAVFEPARPAMAPESAVPQQPVPDSALPATGEYDADAILDAWESGFRDGLTQKNRAILDACAKVIDELITEDMAGDEKELIIHDWIAGWTAYDAALLSNAPEIQPDPDNNNPYGLMIRQTAACEGYALTFQLFMDMLDIECITVYGTNLWGGEKHVWNMVRLEDEEWYCVDVTWDDTADVLGIEDAPVSHKYFNVTSEYMRYNDHQWDATGIPEATSTKYR